MSRRGKYSDYFDEKFQSWPYYDIPEEWDDVVDTAFEKMLEVCPEVKILQIKEKFGELRFYVMGNKECQKIARQVENEAGRLR